ncbi:hypothetical protein MTZ49_02330 [Entomomonas sp. E2T0]|uniref:hypothetical protein n=1 Tax=Entomomonas sp. E2T0 TaxID=2930213 RepID=UPI002228264B|nr:hypothetical protein [Entomomonas sp. E2T0]UYZ84426.1 hypothetical protein MTZ49_02330 [Entomomonas sp. E2T0]
MLPFYKRLSSWLTKGLIVFICLLSLPFVGQKIASIVGRKLDWYRLIDYAYYNSGPFVFIFNFWDIIIGWLLIIFIVRIVGSNQKVYQHSKYEYKLNYKLASNILDIVDITLCMGITVFVCFFATPIIGTFVAYGVASSLGCDLSGIGGTVSCRVPGLAGDIARRLIYYRIPFIGIFLTPFSFVLAFWDIVLVWVGMIFGIKTLNKSLSKDKE